MTFLYSMKQMLRSPLKSVLFFLLLGVTAFLLALGGNLWNINQEMTRELEDNFVTVGTVEQKKEEMEIIPFWDGRKGEYSYYRMGVYGERIDDDVLDFEDENYIIKAKQRPHFGAYIEDLRKGHNSNFLVKVELTPYETGRLDESLPVRIKKVLAGDLEEGSTLYICDHLNENPQTLEAGKTYIAGISLMDFVHGSRVVEEDMSEAEYTVFNKVESVQYTMDGERIPDPFNETVGEELSVVTDGFYETELGKRWLEAAKELDYYMHTIPVTPVDKTKLLLPFHSGHAEVIEGRDIRSEEYEAGAKVCLIPKELAQMQGLSVGDKLKLPLYYADYNWAAPEMYGKNGGWYISSILNAKGKAYQVFNEQEYEIVGIYFGEDREGLNATGENEVIIPWNALPENCWENNITGYRYMNPYNTSFEIANGTIDEFTKKLEEQGIEGLDIRFYDNGYTELQSGLESRNVMSWIFLISGIILAVMILFFFANLFITGQQERIAVERLLGRTKRQCAMSILSGLLVLAAAGIAVGSISGWAATDAAVKMSEETQEFDPHYSNVVVSSTRPEEIEPQKPEADMVLSLASGAGLWAAAFAVSTGFIRKTLKKEPLQILGALEN